MTDDLTTATADHRVVHEHECDCGRLRADMRDLADSLTAQGDEGTARRIRARIGGRS